MARWMTLLLIVGAAATWAAAPAQADFGLVPGSRIELSTMQAGAHADLTTGFTLNDDASGEPDDDLRDVRVSLPPGFWGTPTGFPTCTEVDVSRGGAVCPREGQVGEMTTVLKVPGQPAVTEGPWPVFNLRPSAHYAAEFGANVHGINAFLRVKVRSDDYGLDTVSLSVTQAGLRVSAITVTLWGVPADHNGSGAPRRPLMTNPASCASPMSGTVAIDSWQDIGHWVSAPSPVVPAGSPAGTPAQALTGCDRMPLLKPALTAGPVGRGADQPAGYDVDMTIPQLDDPDGITTPTVKDLAIAFPAGVAISPAAADGLQACSDGQLAPGTDAAPECPDGAKVGTVSITTPALAEPLEGAMYLGQPEVGHPYRLFLVASGPGVMLKLRGEATADPLTGQVITTFRDTPPLPFSELHVQLKGGSRALLANPIACGTYTSSATVTPYSGASDEVATSDFVISADGEGRACPSPLPFAPVFAAGVTNPLAGASSPFTFRLTRDDGQQVLGSIAGVHLPAGLIADVRTVPLCSEAAAASATCPAGTRIGSVEVGSGAGAHPLYLPGDVYLTGPYKGAPFGLSIVVNAIAGPYDLGTVNVRAAVKVNPDASLTVDADPLPTILQGIPLRLRDIVLDFDRPGFMLNPTSCDPSTITANAVSTDGVTVPVSSRFQVTNCAGLGYRPAISVALGGRERSGATSLMAHVAPRAGDANSKRISVELPPHVGFNINNAAGLCTSAQLAARACPESSIVGHASVSSILHQPLSGPVYFVEGQRGVGGSPLPRLFVPLTGEGVTIDLLAQTTLDHSRIVTTFDAIPDVPFSAFDLKIDGGAHGILATDRKVCRSTLRSPVQMDGYNGKLADRSVVVPAGCPLRVLSRELSSKQLAVKVGGLSAGTLRLSGAGIRGAKRTIGSATVATITARRTRRSAPSRVKVRFDPAGPAKARTLRVRIPAAS